MVVSVAHDSAGHPDGGSWPWHTPSAAASTVTRGAGDAAWTPPQARPKRVAVPQQGPVPVPAYLAISLVTRLRISSSSTALAQSAQRERGFGPSGVVKLQAGEGTLGPRRVRSPRTRDLRERAGVVCRVPREGARPSLPGDLLTQSPGSSLTARLGCWCTQHVTALANHGTKSAGGKADEANSHHRLWETCLTRRAQLFAKRQGIFSGLSKISNTLTAEQSVWRTPRDPVDSGCRSLLAAHS